MPQIEYCQKQPKNTKERYRKEEYNHVIMTKEPLMMKSIRILTKYLMKSPKMGRKWELKMPQIRNCQRSTQECKGKKNIKHVIMTKELLMMKSMKTVRNNINDCKEDKV